MRTFLSTSCSSWPTSKPSDWKQAGHYDNPVIAQHSLSTPRWWRIPATTTTTHRLRRDARWLPRLLLRTNKLVGDEFRMLDVSTTNCSDVVSNYSSEIPSNSAAAINNAATNQGSYIYTMRSGKTRSWELFYSDKSRNNLVWSKKNADEVRQEPRQAQKEPGLIKKEPRQGTASTKTNPERTRIDHKTTPKRCCKYQDKFRKNPDWSENNPDKVHTSSERTWTKCKQPRRGTSRTREV